MRQRYQRSLRLRLVVPILSALLVVIGFLSVMSDALLSNSLQVSAENAARKLSGLIARDPDVNADLISNMTDGIRERLRELLGSEELILTVGIYASDDGTVSQRLIHCEASSEHLECLIPDTIDASDRVVTRPSCRNHVDGHSLILVTLAIKSDADTTPLFDGLSEEGSPDTLAERSPQAYVLGSVRLAYSLRTVQSEEAQYRSLILMVAICLMLISGLAADRLARNMLVPIHKVQLALQEATEGNLGVRLEETTEDELGTIANRFNIMVQKLDENREQIRSHNRTLEKKVDERTEELSRAYCELQTLDKIKDSILSNVSHEMRTPLTSIVAAIEILSDFTEQDEVARKEFLDIINNEAARLLRQIGSILDLAKMESESPTLIPKPTDLREIIKRVIASLDLALQAKDLRCSCHHSDQPQVSSCDAKQISRVITSLLNNAIVFSPEGGTIDIHLEVRGDTMVIEVTDDGPGIPREKRGLLFTIFGQLSEGLTDKPKGLGLGLAISKRIAEAHHGDLRYLHKPQRGACFQLSLPVAMQAKASAS